MLRCLEKNASTFESKRRGVFLKRRGVFSTDRIFLEIPALSVRSCQIGNFIVFLYRTVHDLQGFRQFQFAFPLFD